MSLRFSVFVFGTCTMALSISIFSIFLRSVILRSVGMFIPRRNTKSSFIRVSNIPQYSQISSIYTECPNIYLQMNTAACLTDLVLNVQVNRLGSFRMLPRFYGSPQHCIGETMASEKKYKSAMIRKWRNQIEIPTP